MKKAIMLVLTGMAFLVMTACGSNNDAAGGSVQLANPFTEYATKEEAEAAVGFDISLPEMPDDCELIYRVETEGRMLEIICKKDGEEVMRIRKAAGSDDISGNYNDFTSDITAKAGAGSFNVRLRGMEADRFSLATWSYMDYTYSIDLTDGVSQEDIMKLVGEEAGTDSATAPGQ